MRVEAWTPFWQFTLEAEWVLRNKFLCTNANGRASPLFICPIEPTHLFETKKNLLRSISWPILPQFAQKTGGHSGEMQNKHENTTVMKKEKRTICVFKCWLNCQLAIFETLLSLEKPIDDPTPSWSAVPLSRLVDKKNDIRQNCVISNVVSYNIGVVTERCIFRDRKEGRDAPLQQMPTSGALPSLFSFAALGQTSQIVVGATSRIIKERRVAGSMACRNLKRMQDCWWCRFLSCGPLLTCWCLQRDAQGGWPIVW